MREWEDEENSLPRSNIGRRHPRYTVTVSRLSASLANDVLEQTSTRLHVSNGNGDGANDDDVLEEFLSLSPCELVGTINRHLGANTSPIRSGEQSFSSPSLRSTTTQVCLLEESAPSSRRSGTEQEFVVSAPREASLFTRPPRVGLRRPRTLGPSRAAHATRSVLSSQTRVPLREIDPMGRPSERSLSSRDDEVSHDSMTATLSSPRFAPATSLIDLSSKRHQSSNGHASLSSSSKSQRVADVPLSKHHNVAPGTSTENRTLLGSVFGERVSYAYVCSLLLF